MKNLLKRKAPPWAAEFYSDRDDRVQFYRANAVAVVANLPGESCAAMITDPPYSSGGFTRGDRNLTPNQKYKHAGVKKHYPEFAGDNRDQRSFVRWCALWGHEAMRCLVPGGYALWFTDWRQLPSTIDAMQIGGLVFRGICPWDKGRCARAPNTRYFRQQSEFVIWGTRGALADNTHAAGPYEGVYRHQVNPREKLHVTAKPLALMRDLMACAPVGSIVLDPFAGSATTAVAALETGRRFIGAEIDEANFAIALHRLDEALANEATAAA